MAKEEIKPAAQTPSAQPTVPKAQTSTEEKLAEANVRLNAENERLLAELKRLSDKETVSVPQRPRDPKASKRYWKVDLDKSGPVTPSAFFRQEKPGDPRGYAIEADDTAGAWQEFCRLHGILGCSVAPVITEMSEADAKELREQKAPAAKGVKVNAVTPMLQTAGV